MSTVESLLQPHLDREIYLQRRLEEYQAAMRAIELDLMGVRQRIQGIREAAEALAGNVRSRRRAPGQARSMSLHWQRMLQQVDALHNHFSYADLTRAAESVGQSLSNDSLRSQMSDYKGRGWVESVGLGAFRLTPSGRAAAGITELNEKASDAEAPEADLITGPVGRESGLPPSAPEGSTPSGSTSVRDSSSFEEDSDDDVPF